jgi:hypothetical protein
MKTGYKYHLGTKVDQLGNRIFLPFELLQSLETIPISKLKNKTMDFKRKRHQLLGGIMLLILLLLLIVLLNKN